MQKRVELSLCKGLAFWWSRRMRDERVGCVGVKQGNGNVVLE